MGLPIGQMALNLINGRQTELCVFNLVPGRNSEIITWPMNYGAFKSLGYTLHLIIFHTNVENLIFLKINSQIGAHLEDPKNPFEHNNFL